MNFANFLRTPFLQGTFGRLVLRTSFKSFSNTSQKTLFSMRVFGARYFFSNIFRRQLGWVIFLEILLSKYITALKKDFPSDVGLRIYWDFSSFDIYKFFYILRKTLPNKKKFKLTITTKHQYVEFLQR